MITRSILWNAFQDEAPYPRYDDLHHMQTLVERTSQRKK